MKNRGKIPKSKPDPPKGPPNLRWRMGQNPVPPPPGLPRRGEGDSDTLLGRTHEVLYGRPPTEERFISVMDEVVRHLNRQTRSDPSIKRGEGFPADREGIEWERRRRLHQERDIMFQVRVMDWMIGFCLVVLGVVFCVGLWAIWQMVTRGWTW